MCWGENSAQRLLVYSQLCNIAFPVVLDEQCQTRAHIAIKSEQKDVVLYGFAFHFALDDICLVANFS